MKENNLDDDKFLVYGGMTNELLKEIVELNIEDEDSKVYWEKYQNTWTCLNENGKESKHALDLGRGGISYINFTEVHPFDNKIRENCIIFYGNGKIVKFKSQNCEFRILNQYGTLHEARQYHTACTFGKYMICFGGINNFKNILDKVCCYDIIEQEWKDIKIIPNSFNRWITKEGK